MPLLLFAACATGNTATNFANAKISEITYSSMNHTEDGSATGERTEFKITDSTVIKQLAERLDALLKGKTETPLDPTPGANQRFSVLYADGTEKELEISGYGLWVSGKHYDCKVEDVEPFILLLWEEGHTADGE